MSTEIVIPSLGESITEGVIATWLKGDGAFVEQDEDILELETDKITMPIPSPITGLLKHTASEGDTVKVGAIVGAIEESAERPAAKEQATAAEQDAAPTAEPSDDEEATAPEEVASKSPETVQPAAASSKAESTPQPSAPVAEPASTPDGGVRTTPLARKLAEENGVDLATIPGTGPGGRIREHDVLAYIQSHKDNGAPRVAASVSSDAGSGASRGVRRERMSQLRQRIAVRLVEAQQTAAMLTTFNECDMSGVMALRSKFKDSFQQKHNVKLGFMSFFMKAAVSALRQVPSVNAFIVEGEKGPEVEYHDYCDIAVAVGTDKGLVVPVLRNCESRGFASIEQGILDLAAKARDGKLTLEDMQGGTFTISNGGVYGSMLSTPILNPPQSGILGLHNIIRRPVENPDKPGSGEVVVRPMMYLALSYDHRIVDGAGAVGFLKHIKECIEDPERLLLDV